MRRIIIPRLFLMPLALVANSIPFLQKRECMISLKAVTAKGFESESGMCSAFCRELDNACGSTVYQRYHGGSATETAQNFEGTIYEVESGAPGDFYFYTDRAKHGPNGHVIRRIRGNFAVHCSSIYGISGDCRGIIYLGFFGKPDKIVRTTKTRR